MSGLKFLICLCFYARPIMVENMLNSIKQQTYDNWHLHFIDDGSPEGKEGRSVVERIMKDYLHKISFDYIPDTPEQKHSQGGSRHGHFLNEAILNIDSDIVICCCDDDALHEDYLTNLNNYYLENPEVMCSYCHVVPYNPHVEVQGPHCLNRHYPYNHTHPLVGACAIDSCQMTYRSRCFKESPISYPYPRTRNLDCEIFNQLAHFYGLAPFNGISPGQYKAIFGDQLSYRNDHNAYTPTDTIR